MTKGSRAALWVGVSAGILLLIAANVHLVYIAMTSQPDCVTHARVGETIHAAAKSACTPR